MSLDPADTSVCATAGKVPILRNSPTSPRARRNENGRCPYGADAPSMLNDPGYGATARAVARLEQQVLTAPFTGIVVLYGRLYGPGTVRCMWTMPRAARWAATT